mgnify:CR=1 FL=1
MEQKNEAKQNVKQEAKSDEKVVKAPIMVERENGKAFPQTCQEKYLRQDAHTVQAAVVRTLF